MGLGNGRALTLTRERTMENGKLEMGTTLTLATTGNHWKTGKLANWQTGKLANWHGQRALAMIGKGNGHWHWHGATSTDIGGTRIRWHTNTGNLERDGQWHHHGQSEAI
ncbi:hypothetical protein FIBSPDRAFT_881288 [Athelia psychrophila]|uniref:Uncharacterized protein n=1 Tax=Athelia psychrophila TaxID=1759441 RepID=A0A166WHI5_9AGAM|nr:hypothetical protein FIBSPDRAFT_881288 [Fibularhizoctonia sp. CBS 109695]